MANNSLETVLSNVEADIKNVVVKAMAEGKIVAQTVETDVEDVIEAAVKDGKLVLTDIDNVIDTVIDDVKKVFETNVATSNNHSFGNRLTQIEQFSADALALIATINQTLDVFDGGTSNPAPVSGSTVPAKLNLPISTNFVSRFDHALLQSAEVKTELQTLTTRVKGLV